MNALTPSETVALLEYYYLPNKARKHNTSNALETLLRHGLLEQNDDTSDSIYGISAKGKAHVYNLLQVPLPVQVWVLPESTGPTP